MEKGKDERKRFRERGETDRQTQIGEEIDTPR